MAGKAKFDQEAGKNLTESVNEALRGGLKKYLLK